MGKIKRIVVDREKCIGAASCIAVYPGIFSLDDQNKAVIAKKDGTRISGPVEREELMVADNVDDDMLLMAAQSCPTLAIFLYDEEGNQVYP